MMAVADKIIDRDGSMMQQTYNSQASLPIPMPQTLESGTPCQPQPVAYQQTLPAHQFLPQYILVDQHGRQQIISGESAIQTQS